MISKPGAVTSGCTGGLVSTLAPCGSVVGFLPPSSFLIHVRSDADACLARVATTPGVLGVAALSGALRKDPVLSTAAASSARVLVLSLSEGASYDALARDLAPQLAALCPSCTLQSASAAVASLSALENCPAACKLDAPADCGCTVPEALANAVAAHPDVLWLSRYEQAHMFDAFSNGMVQTTDLANWGGIQAAFGACSDVTCASTPNLPFSQIGSPAPLLYGPFLTPIPPILPPPTEATRELSEALSDDASRSLQGTCSGPCQTGACGQGFGNCAGLSTPLAATLLDGTNQLVQVVDSGIDYGSPFFYGTPNPPPINNAAPTAAVLSAHRKVPYIWSYADGIDAANGHGHGTHVSGSIAGFTVNPRASDAAVLSAANGAAPMARLLVTDVVCNAVAPANCNRPGAVPARPLACGPNAVCLPTDITALYAPAVASGAFISANAWGSGTGSVYDASSAAIDAFVHNNPDMLLVFSSNGAQGAAGPSTLSHQAVTKNSITVGAIADGFPAHQAKTQGLPTGGAPTGGAVLYQSLDGRACGGVLAYAATLALPSLRAPTPTTSVCPAAINPATCYAMYSDANGLNNSLPSVPGGFPDAGVGSQYALGTPAQAELPLCCTCTLQNVVDGCRLPGQICDPTIPNGLQETSNLVAALQSTYSARFPVDFSSLGPAQDNRNKPDISAPGLEVMSARSGSNWLYGGGSDGLGDFTCSAATTISLSGTFAEVTSSGSDAVPIGSITIGGAGASLREPVNLVSITVPVTTIVPPAEADLSWFELRVVSSSENAPLPATQFQPVPMRMLRGACAAGPSPCAALIFTLPGGGWQMGPTWTGTFQIFAAPGATVTLNAGGAAQTTNACFLPASGSMSATVQATLTTTRGGAQAYVTAMTGTSMSAPVIAGTAALVRQYYISGYLSAGVATPGSGFFPSAALVKATLIAAATPLLSQSFDALFQETIQPWSGPDSYLAEGGFGVPQIQRVLSFATYGTATRAAGQLPTLVLPGTIIPAGGGSRGVEPVIAGTNSTNTFCLDTTIVGAGPIILPLIITLVWTDRAALPGATNQLVNNLDLTVVTPTGAIARGNPPNGNSTAPSQVADSLNNVEVLTFPTPVSTVNPDGSRALPAYLISIKGTNVPIGPQSYSLVASGPGLSLSTVFLNNVCVPPTPSPSPTPSPAAPPAPPPAAEASVPQSALIITGSVLGAALLIVIIATVVYFVGCSCSRGGSSGGGSPSSAATKSVKSAWPENAAKGDAVTTPNALRTSLNASARTQDLDLARIPAAVAAAVSTPAAAAVGSAAAAPATGEAAAAVPDWKASPPQLAGPAAV